jgi:hypothetical protein
MRHSNKLREAPVLDAEPGRHSPEACRPVKVLCAVCRSKVGLVCHGAEVVEWAERELACVRGHRYVIEASWLTGAVAAHLDGAHHPHAVTVPRRYLA